MAPTIHVVRHAEGWHNVGKLNIQDPLLTPRGRLQCAMLNDAFPHMNSVTHLVASPMQRTIGTCILSFTPVSNCQRIILLPELQETGKWKCDTGSSRHDIENRFGARVDASRVVYNWNTKNQLTPWEGTVVKLEASRAGRGGVNFFNLSQAEKDRFKRAAAKYVEPAVKI